MYDLIRLLLPKFDTERQTYGLKEGMIPKVGDKVPQILLFSCLLLDSDNNFAENYSSTCHQKGFWTEDFNPT